jgi:O-acetyl-ADP-ribose deacetylase (regulator of RNase III)
VSILLRNTETAVLRQCLDEGITSISFPALGTGNIGVEKSVAAHIMFDQVIAFAKDQSTHWFTSPHPVTW